MSDKYKDCDCGRYQDCACGTHKDCGGLVSPFYDVRLCDDPWDAQIACVHPLDFAEGLEVYEYDAHYCAKCGREVVEEGEEWIAVEGGETLDASDLDQEVVE